MLIRAPGWSVSLVLAIIWFFLYSLHQLIHFPLSVIPLLVMSKQPLQVYILLFPPLLAFFLLESFLLHLCPFATTLILCFAFLSSIFFEQHVKAFVGFLLS